MNPDRLVEQIRSVLTPDLLSPEWRRRSGSGRPDSTGHCYVASEVLYHLYGRDHGYRPCVLSQEGLTHWYLEHPSGARLDPTADQFAQTPSYDRGRRTGFLTREPSRRAREVIRRLGL